MITENRINNDLINELYYRWLNERDVVVQSKLKQDIKNRVSPYEFLLYSAKNTNMPFRAFRKIFSLDSLFTALEQMKKQGQDISNLTNQLLLVETPEDIKGISNVATREFSSEISNFSFVFKGSTVFVCGDIKNIGKKFPNAYVNNLSLEQVEQMVKTQKDYRGIPITITIENMGQLSLEKLANIEKFFDIEGIKIQEKDKIGRANQGESTPLNLMTYKKIRTVVNDIINNLYVDQNSDKMHTDFQLATQIIDSIVERVEFDYEANRKSRTSEESINASGMVGLLTGKSICKGYSEIFRNVLSCVDIECLTIDGTDMENKGHTWNQVKLGDIWLNADVTYASDKLRAGNFAGDLFTSDMVFYGDRRTFTFEKGKEVNGKNIETTVNIGGHSSRVYTSNCKQCGSYIPPYIISSLIKRSKNYDEDYRREGKSPDYKGVVPYVGSNVQKARATSKEFSSSVHSGH